MSGKSELDSIVNGFFKSGCRISPVGLGTEHCDTACDHRMVLGRRQLDLVPRRVLATAAALRFSLLARQMARVSCLGRARGFGADALPGLEPANPLVFLRH